nr:538_t:CDS:2 [Entrophospora candida]
MELINILVASDEFQLTKLISHIQTYLLQNQSIILQHDPIEILEIIYNHETCSSLSDKYINGPGFKNKVLPFERLFDKQTFFEILEILKLKHIRIISSWINKKDQYFYNNTKNLPFTFKLLFSTTRDGFSIRKFHRLCDDKGSTLTITRLNNDNQIIGGYNPVNWKPFDKLKTFDINELSSSSSSLEEKNENRTDEMLYESFFRGRRLIGKKINLEQNNYEESSMITSATSSEMELEEEKKQEIVVEKTRNWETVKKFDSFLVWQHNEIPKTSNDQIIKSLEWIKIANIVSTV